MWEKWERYLDPAGGTNHGNLSSIYWVCKLFGPSEPRVDFAGRCLPIDVRVIRSLKAMILAWASISRFRSYCGEAFPNQATYSGSGMYFARRREQVAQSDLMRASAHPTA